MSMLSMEEVFINLPILATHGHYCLVQLGQISGISETFSRWLLTHQVMFMLLHLLITAKMVPVAICKLVDCINHLTEEHPGLLSTQQMLLLIILTVAMLFPSVQVPLFLLLMIQP